MLLIGSTGRKSGKTTLVCQIIRKFRKKNIIAIKVSTIEKADKDFHHDLPATSKKGFCLTEETRTNTKKDTSKMLAVGDSRVFWLRAEKKCLRKGWALLLKTIGRDAVCICESNSLRQIVRPGLFIMVKGPRCRKIKPSAKEVLNFADRIISPDDNGFDNFLRDLRLISEKWSITTKCESLQNRDSQ